MRPMSTAKVHRRPWDQLPLAGERLNWWTSWHGVVSKCSTPKYHGSSSLSKWKCAFWDIPDIPLYETVPQVEAQSCQLNCEKRKGWTWTLDGQTKGIARHVWQKKSLDFLGRHRIQISYQCLPLPVLNLVPVIQLSSPVQCIGKTWNIQSLRGTSLKKSIFSSLCIHWAADANAHTHMTRTLKLALSPSLPV